MSSGCSPKLEARIRIALSGKSGAGKTEFASHLVRELKVVRASTGDLYRSISQLLYGEVRKDRMNMLTRALRGMDTNCVLNAALRHSDNQHGIVFDSMRFEEDYATLKAQGFLLVRLESVVGVRHYRLRQRGEVFDPDDLDLDKSETGLDSAAFHCVLRNDGKDIAAFLEGALKQVKQHLHTFL